MPRPQLRFLLPFLGALLCGSSVSAQSQVETPGGTRIEILSTDDLKFDRSVSEAQRLIGHVRLKHADAIMQCDSAHLYPDQTMKAFGHVGIRQADTLNITGDRLDYNGRDRTGIITGNVVLTDPGMRMTTEAIAYSLKDHSASYASGAQITSVRDNNTLTSQRGTYLSGPRKFLFSGNVRIEHPERTITSDTLHYTTSTGVAEFFGPTTITQGETQMWCERGSYDTRTERGRFTRAGRVMNKGQELSGDSLHYDKRNDEGKAWGHVAVVDSAQKITVLGDVGRHSGKSDKSMITGHAEMLMRMGEDTLFLHADTLFANNDPDGSKRVVARKGARFYKRDMQGVCDTLVYAERDSVIELHGSPVLWSGRDQITGRYIAIRLRDGHAHRLHVQEEALLASQVDSSRFDQVTGTTITGFFVNDELNRIIAEGNTRTVYFARETKDSVEQVTGLNRADCSRIEVTLDSGEVNTITFLTEPDATMYPLDKAPPDQQRMRGFTWHEAIRPTDRADIFSGR